MTWRSCSAAGCNTDAFDRLLARAPRLAWVHSATSGVEGALTPAALRARRGRDQCPRRVQPADRGIRADDDPVGQPPAAAAPRAAAGADLAAARGRGAARRDGRHRRAGLDRPGGRGAGDGVRLPRRRGAPIGRGRAASAAPDDGPWRTTRASPSVESRSAPSARRCSIEWVGPRRCRSSSASPTSSSSRHPLTPETEAMINDETLAMVKPGRLADQRRARAPHRRARAAACPARGPARRRGARHVPRRAAPGRRRRSTTSRTSS